MFVLHHRTGLAAAVLLALSCAALAQPAAPSQAAAAKPPLNVHPFVLEVDRNHDGCMSAEEWQAAGAPQSAYDMLKDAHGCVTETKMDATAPPDGVDRNHDGKLTLAELVAFDKQMSAKRKAGGTPPPPPAASH